MITEEVEEALVEKEVFEDISASGLPWPLRKWNASGMTASTPLRSMSRQSRWSYSSYTTNPNTRKPWVDQPLRGGVKLIESLRSNEDWERDRTSRLLLDRKPVVSRAARFLAGREGLDWEGVKTG